VAGPMPRIQAVILPILRAALPGVAIGSWVPDVDYREYPYINVRRLGGIPADVELFDRPTIELTVYGNVDLPTTEELYNQARLAIWRAWKYQTVVPAVGHINYYQETMGPTQFDSPFDDTWRVQGLIQLGLRPPIT